jgi:hypothetical protein
MLQFPWVRHIGPLGQQTAELLWRQHDRLFLSFGYILNFDDLDGVAAL